MAIQIYPHLRTLTREYLEQKGYEESFVQQVTGDNGTFYYEAGIVRDSLVLVSGNKNQPIENLIEKLRQAKVDKRPYFNPGKDNKIQVFHHTLKSEKC